MDANFSFHALERVIGRISMTHRELAEILDADLVINVGQENNSNRTHKLFYSERGKICFVAIQDVKTGTVVTVFPIDYHENISWAISIESQNQAKKVITKDIVSPNNLDTINTNATVFRISANIADSYGRYKKIVNLGSWPCAPYEYSIDGLVKDEEFIDYLADKIRVKISTVNDEESFIPTIVIRLGNNGDPVIFSTSELIATNA